MAWRSKKAHARKRPNRTRSGGGANADRTVSKGGNVPIIVARSLPLFGYQKRVNLNYYTNGTISTGAGFTAGSYTFAANGLYDPDITSIGGQPSGFDQMMVFFEHYTVKRARIQVVFVNGSTTTPFSFGIYNSPDAAAITNVERLMEGGSLVAVQASPSPQYGSTIRAAKSINISQFLGIRDLMSNSEARGSIAANPTELAYFQLICWNSSTVGVASTHPFQALISFDAVFTERREPTTSAEFKSLFIAREDVRMKRYEESKRFLNEEGFTMADAEQDCLGRPLNGISDSMTQLVIHGCKPSCNCLPPSVGNSTTNRPGCHMT